MLRRVHPGSLGKKLPMPLEVHTDDATRAVLSCFDIAARSGVGFEGVKAWAQGFRYSEVMAIFGGCFPKDP